MNKQNELPSDVAAKVSSLRDYLDFLDSHNQFIVWPDRVYPEPGIREVVSAAGRDFMTQPAILFDKIAGCPGQSVVAGVHGSFANIALLLGMPKDSSIKEMFYEIISRWDKTKSQISRIEPDKAPIHQNRVENNINLHELIPLYKVNEYDGGYYLAKASVVSHDPLEPDDFGKQNISISRIQIHGPDLITIMSAPVHDFGRQIMMADQTGKPLRVAVMLGNHPAMSMFAATPIAYEESEYDYASGMMGAPMVLTKSGNGLDILAESEMVIECEYVHGSFKLEGPFGEFPGSYSGIRKVPTFKVTAVSYRNQPIFENIFIGKGWTEHDTLVGLNTSAPIYAQIKKDFPEVQAVNALYEHGMTGIISVHQRYGGFAKTVAMRALSTPHGSMYLKNLIMVDAEIDPFNLTDVMWALSVRTRKDDIVIIPEVAGIPIDPAATTPGKSHKLIIDATTHCPPDIIGTDTQMVELPAGERIDEIQRRVKRLQEGKE